MSDEDGGTASTEASAWIIAQSICPHISGLLSMIGSSWISKCVQFLSNTIMIM